MLEYLMTQAQSSTYNKGWKNKVKLYEEIAEEPGMIIIGAEMLCKIDEEQGLLVEEREAKSFVLLIIGTVCIIGDALMLRRYNMPVI